MEKYSDKEPPRLQFQWRGGDPSIQFYSQTATHRPSIRVLLWVSEWRPAMTAGPASASPWPPRRSSCPLHQTSPEAGTRLEKILACWWNGDPERLPVGADGTAPARRQSRLRCSLSPPACLPTHSAAGTPSRWRSSEELWITTIQ